MAHVVDQTNLVHGTDTGCLMAQQPCIVLLGPTFHTSTVLSAHLHEDSDYRHTLTTRPDMPDESSHHVTPQENLHELKSFRLFQYFLSPIKQIRELQELVLGQESLQEGVSVFW